MHGRPWERCRLEGSMCCSKISMYFSALMVPSQKCKLPLPSALTQPHTMTDSLDGPFLLLSGHEASISFKNDLSDHNTLFHCVMVHPRCLRVQRSRWRFWTWLT